MLRQAISGILAAFGWGIFTHDIVGTVLLGASVFCASCMITLLLQHGHLKLKQPKLCTAKTKEKNSGGEYKLDDVNQRFAVLLKLNVD